MTKEKLSAILMPWLACPWGAMAHTSDECLQVGVASFTYLEVGLMVAMALCFVLIGMLWRYGAKMERRAKKAERDRDVCQQWYQAQKHKPQKVPKAETQKQEKTEVQDAPLDDKHSAKEAPQDPQRSPTIELDITPTPPRKLYARQDAQDANRLINLSQKFDPYEHIFVITLDNGSDTEGCFELVEENAAKCLGNSDNIKCCYVDAGVNATNFKQEAGRVRINGQTAEVLKPITITNKSATSNGH